MKIEKEIEKTLAFDPEKVDQCYKELVEVFRKHKLRVGEILIAYGNLGYTLGASVEGYGEKGPGLKELERLYYTQASAGLGLMLSGLTISSWYDTYTDTKVADNTEKDIQEKK